MLWPPAKTDVMCSESLRRDTDDEPVQRNARNL